MWPHKTALIHGMEQIARLLYRENSSEPWGFRLSGGKDQGQPLQISQVGKSWKGRKLRTKITLYTQSPIPSRLSRTVWPKRLVCSPTISWSVSLVSRSTRWPMTRSLSMRQRSRDNTFQKYKWWRGKKIWQKLLSGGAFDPEGRRQVHHGHWTVSERKQGWKVVKRKRVSDELPVTCAAGLHVEIHESCAPCQLLNMWLLLVQVSQNFPSPPKGAKVI